MSDKRTTPEPVEGVSRRKRPAPTIDLTATDVSTPAPETEPHATASPDGEHPSEEPESLADNGVNQRHGVAPRQLFFAGLGGAATVALVFFGLWLVGLV